LTMILEYRLASNFISDRATGAAASINFAHVVSPTKPGARLAPVHRAVRATSVSGFHAVEHFSSGWCPLPSLALLNECLQA
jgi:hypothetical protein